MAEGPRRAPAGRRGRSTSTPGSYCVIRLVGDPRFGEAREPEADRALVLLAQVPEQPGGAGEQRDRLERVRGQAEVEHRRGDRARDVQRQHAAVDLGTAPRSRAAARRARRRRRARRSCRAGAPCAGRRPGAAGARSPERPPRLAVLADDRTGLGAGGEAVAQHRPRVLRRAEDTEPQPSRPAATAPWSDSGAAESVIRAAWTLGTRPCSAIAQARSVMRRSRSSGARPISGRKNSSVSVTWPIRSPVRSGPGPHGVGGRMSDRGLGLGHVAPLIVVLNLAECAASCSTLRPARPRVPPAVRRPVDLVLRLDDHVRRAAVPDVRPDRARRWRSARSASASSSRS